MFEAGTTEHYQQQPNVSEYKHLATAVKVMPVLRLTTVSA